MPFLGVGCSKEAVAQLYVGYCSVSDIAVFCVQRRGVFLFVKRVMKFLLSVDVGSIPSRPLPFSFLCLLGALQPKAFDSRCLSSSEK